VWVLGAVKKAPRPEIRIHTRKTEKRGGTPFDQKDLLAKVLVVDQKGEMNAE